MNKTYLYIKEHNITGMKYFGKTTSDPYTYCGSGKYWINHIKKHGKEFVTTKWVSEPFTDKELLVEFATFVSEELDIVNSDKWANLILENGLDGAPVGFKHSEETKSLLKKYHTGRKREYKVSSIARENMSRAQQGRSLSEQHKESIRLYAKSRPKEVNEKISNSLKNKKHSEETILKRALSNSKPRGAYGKSEHCANRPKLICPNCSKSGNGGSMMRYHFNNCKLIMSKEES